MGGDDTPSPMNGDNRKGFGVIENGVFFLVSQTCTVA
jgi:hypothetical protein